MRFLLISDTHGNLGIIHELAAKAQADAVIHAGDFGFYDEGSHVWTKADSVTLFKYFGYGTK